MTNTVTCLLVTDNLKVTPSDFDQYCITAPTNPALPNSGQQLCGLYDVKPALFGQSDNLARPVADLGGKLTRVYNGFDATVNARFLTRGGASVAVLALAVRLGSSGTTRSSRTCLIAA